MLFQKIRRLTLRNCSLHRVYRNFTIFFSQTMKSEPSTDKRTRPIDFYFSPVSKRPCATKDDTDTTLVDKELIKDKVELNTTTETLEVDKKVSDDLFAALSPELQTLLDLEYRTIHPSWFAALFKEIQKPYFLKLKKFLNSEFDGKKVIFPPTENIYSWSNLTPYNNVKVVILGQDPYHNTNQAHGLSFSVMPGVTKPPSLKNIFTEVKKEYSEFKEPKSGYLGGWAAQGVLLLNAALTVRAHEPNSHANQGWESFTDAIINHLSKNSKHIVFMLWGAYAQKKGSSIDLSNHMILKSPHPSPFSVHRGFFGNNHFIKANEYLVKQGKGPIDWTSPENIC